MNDMTANRFHDGEGYRCVLARIGRSKLHITYISDLGVEHRALGMLESLRLEPLPHRGGLYPVDRMVRRFAAIGRARGITEAAKAELSRARS